MPPRKKAKASAASTPADAQPKTPQDTGPTADEELLNDAWTEEETTQMFKGMMKWKPTGMHKHFRMLSIHADMRSHGFAADDVAHTRIPGVWAKMRSLYALHTLDEREDNFAFADEPDPTDPSEFYSLPDFDLPEEDFGELIWKQRFHSAQSEASSSPPAVPFDDEKLPYVPDMGMLNDLPDGVRSQQAESVADATPTPKKGKNPRAKKETAKSAKPGKGQAAKNSKAQSVHSESAEEEDEDDDEDESSDESEEEETAPSTRRTNRSKGKAQPPPKRTRKR